MYHYQLVMKVDLQLFAKDGPTGEKTEKPTAKKIKDSRDEGQVAKSQELNTAVLLLAFFVLLKFYSANVGGQLSELFQHIINKIPDYTDGIETYDMYQLLVFCITQLLKISVPILLFGLVVSFLGNVLQFKWHVTAKPMKPKLNKISPLSGFKRMFSVQTLMKTIISIAKIILLNVLNLSFKTFWIISTLCVFIL